MAIVRMTAQEMRDYVEKNNEMLQAAYDAAEPAPFEDDGKPPVILARGWAAFEEYLRKNANNKNIAEPTVSITIKIPQSYATGLRATGRGWRTRTSNYVVRGIKRGTLGKVVA